MQIKSFATRDEQQVAGYAKVMERVFTSWQDIVLTENHVKQLHRDLLVHSEKDAWHRGSYKTSTNSVVAFDEDGKQLGVVFESATPFDTPRLMTELVNWFVEERGDGRLHPLLLMGLARRDRRVCPLRGTAGIDRGTLIEREDFGDVELSMQGAATGDFVLRRQPHAPGPTRMGYG